MKAIIVCPALRRTVHPEVVGPFKWMQQHEAYVWEGRELDCEEFNRKVDQVMDRFATVYDRPLKVRMVTDADALALKVSQQQRAANMREIRLKKIRERQLQPA